MTDMAAAYDLAAAAVKQRFAVEHPNYLDVLGAIDKRDVAVFDGCYDSVQEVLQRLGIPFEMNPKRRLKDARILFANCSSRDSHSLAGKVENLVGNGAWLISSDWSLHNVVEPAFPNTIRKHRSGHNTGDEVVSVEPGLNSYWEEVVVLGADPQWWLEGSSYPIEILNDEAVTVSAASHEMLVNYNAPVVAVQFDWKAGRVFHVISHFWLKRSRTPAEKYRGPCTDFLKRGMRLSDDAIEAAIREAKVKPDEINFAMIQSAATSTELIGQLCVAAVASAD